MATELIRTAGKLADIPIAVSSVGAKDVNGRYKVTLSENLSAPRLFKYDMLEDFAGKQWSIYEFTDNSNEITISDYTILDGHTQDPIAGDSLVGRWYNEIADINLWIETYPKVDHDGDSGNLLRTDFLGPNISMTLIAYNDGEVFGSGVIISDVHGNPDDNFIRITSGEDHVMIGGVAPHIRPEIIDGCKYGFSFSRVSLAVLIDHFEISNLNHNGSVGIFVAVDGYQVDNTIIESNMVHSFTGSANGNTYGIFTNGYGCRSIVRNNIVHNLKSPSGSCWGIGTNSACGVICHGNTVVDNALPDSNNAMTMLSGFVTKTTYLINNISIDNNSTVSMGYSEYAVVESCITSDATGTIQNKTSIDVKFVDPANHDYRIDDSSSIASKAGSPISIDDNFGTYSYNLDFEGKARDPATPSIGAFEIIKSGVASLISMIRRRII